MGRNCVEKWKKRKRRRKLSFRLKLKRLRDKIKLLGSRRRLFCKQKRLRKRRGKKK